MKRWIIALVGVGIVWGCGGSGIDGGASSLTGGASGAAGASTGGASGGGTGGAAGGSGSGGSAASGGAAGSCASLTDQYAAAVAQAKHCTAGTTPSCAQTADTSIAGCGYYAWVDGSNTQALQELDTLKKQWKDLACTTAGGCAVGGWGPTGPASCTGAGGTGSCQ